MTTPARTAIEAAAQLVECADSAGLPATALTWFVRHRTKLAAEIRALPGDPQEPTEEMVQAGMEWFRTAPVEEMSRRDSIVQLFLAMSRARPSAATRTERSVS